LIGALCTPRGSVRLALMFPRCGLTEKTRGQRPYILNALRNKSLPFHALRNRVLRAMGGIHQPNVHYLHARLGQPGAHLMNEFSNCGFSLGNCGEYASSPIVQIRPVALRVSP
jgi:hypothetical protein